MKCARGIALLSSLGFALALNAAEFEDGMVPVDLVEVFVGGHIQAGLPADFPVPDMPDNSGLRVLGSLERNPMVQQVMLHNSGTWESGRDILRNAYVATGWLDVSVDRSPSTVIGIQQLSLCHDQLGLIEFAPNGENRIRADRQVFAPTARGALDCAQIKAQRQNQGLLNVAMQLMPVLDPPASAVTGGFPGVALGAISRVSVGGSGLNFRADRDGSVVVPQSSVAALHEHYRAQLAAQGWRSDAAALGTFSSTSVWRRTAPIPEGFDTTVEELPLIGILNILQADGDRYDILFRLISQGGDDIDALGPPLNVPALGIRGIPPGSLTPSGTIGGAVFNEHGFVSGGPIVLP